MNTILCDNAINNGWHDVKPNQGQKYFKRHLLVLLCLLIVDFMDMLLLFNICTIAICIIQLKRRLQHLLFLNMSVPNQSQKTMVFILPKILIADVNTYRSVAAGSEIGLVFETNSTYGSISKSHKSQYCIDGVSDISDDETECFTSDLAKSSKDAIRRYTLKSYAKTNTTHHAGGNTTVLMSSYFVDTISSYKSSTDDDASLEDEEDKDEIKEDKEFMNYSSTSSTDTSKYINDFDLDMLDTYSTTASESGSDVDDDNSSISSVDLDLDQDWSWLNEGLGNTDSRDSSDVDSDSGFCDTKSTTSSRDDVMDILSCNARSDVNDDIGDLREWNWLVSTHFI